jgi:hypothetical protein
MKRKIIFFVMLIALAGLSTLQSCYKDGTVQYTHSIFTAPELVAPLDASTVHLAGTATTVDLKWTSTNPDSDPVDADVYFGTAESFGLYKADLHALTLTVPVIKGQTYFWLVNMKDKNGIPSPAVPPDPWSFTVFEPIGIFVGAYTVDEPAEGWTYPVNFTKNSDNVLKIDQYWASWPSFFTLDFTANTYSMPLTDFGGGYSAIESGTINPATGTLVGTYTIYHPAAVAIETGTHTYTKN